MLGLTKCSPEVVSSTLDSLIITQSTLSEFFRGEDDPSTDRFYQLSYAEGYEAAAKVARDYNEGSRNPDDLSELVNRHTATLGWTAIMYCRMSLELFSRVRLTGLTETDVMLFGQLIHRVASTMYVNEIYLSESGLCDIDQLIDEAESRAYCGYVWYSRSTGLMESSNTRPKRADARTRIRLFISRRAYDELHKERGDAMFRFSKAVSGIYVIMDGRKSR